MADVRYRPTHNSGNAHIISPHLKKELDSINTSAQGNPCQRQEEKIYSSKYQSETQRYNYYSVEGRKPTAIKEDTGFRYDTSDADKTPDASSAGIISPIMKPNNRAREVCDKLKISCLPAKLNAYAPTEGAHGSQIYTFREQNKNEEYFKSGRRVIENPDPDISDSDFVTGYFSPDESACISLDKRISQPEKVDESQDKKSDNLYEVRHTHKYLVILSI